MELLARRFSTLKASLDGSPVGFWHGFPIEEAVTNGLWLVILDLAKKEGRDVATSEDVAVFAGRVDTLVNAGLSAGFANVESAVNAFAKKVIDPVHRAALLGFHPGDPPQMAAWKEIAAGKPVSVPPTGIKVSGLLSEGEIGTFLGRPAALFFVRVINGAIRYRARFEARLAELERINVLRGPLTWIPDSDFEFARRTIRQLGGRPSVDREAMPWGAWLESIQALEACRDRIARYRRWPVRIDAVPRGILRTSVEEGWLDTIVLMAIGRVKSESDILSQPVFWKGLSLYGETCRGEKGIGPLQARTIKMLVSRVSEMDARTRADLSAGIESSIKKMSAAFDAYEEMTDGMAAAHGEMVELAERIRKCGERLARSGKGKESIHEDREEAAERLSRLQEQQDRAKSEFRANYFPAIFLPETAPEEALMGGGWR